LAAEARQSKADCRARPSQPSQGRASQAAEPNQAIETNQNIQKMYFIRACWNLRRTSIEVPKEDNEQ